MSEITGRLPPAEKARKIKLRLDLARAQAFDGVAEGASGLSCVRQFSDAIDQVVRELWDAEGARDAALVATGGWGRREVAPFSDLDFVLLTTQSRPSVSELADAILYPLWDSGMAVGHSVASPRDAARLAREDLATSTAMLDARWIAGNKELAEELQVRTRAAVAPGGNANDFVARLTDEMERRHRKFGASLYLLEPNLKHGIGALRDLDTIAWIARARFGVNELTELVAVGQLSARQVAIAREARDFLHRIRALVQHTTGRRTDQLTFEIQEQLAPMLVEVESRPSEVRPAVAPAVEELMRRYYLHARGVVTVAERFAEAARVPKRKRPRIARVDASFLLFNGKLSVKEPWLFEERPTEMLRLFRVAAEHDVPIYGHTKDLIEERLAAGETTLTGNPDAGRLFLDALVDVSDARQPSLFAQMHQAGLVTVMMPEFGRCTGRVQHDLYHVYTVDQHQLKALAMLKRHFRGEERDVAEQVGVAVDRVDRREVLFLATLLHDVGKPLGKGHAEKGARVAGVISRRLGLAADDVADVEFLVRQHLTMSHLSQRRDLSDPEVIARFAEVVETEQRLASLYLLTRCDTAMTAPGNLNEWKDQLLGELFKKTMAYLCGAERPDKLSAREQAEIARARVVERVRRRASANEDGDPDRVEHEARAVRAFVDGLDDSFVTQLSSGQLLRQFRLVRRREGEGAAIAMSVAYFPLKEHSELAVVADDAPGLLADIAGALAASGVDVLEAAIGTGLPAQPGDPPLAVDLFHVRDAAGLAIPKDDPRWTKIENDLVEITEHAHSDVRARDLILRRRSSGLRPRVTPEVPTKVEVDNEWSAEHSIVEVFAKDRPGVLHVITRCLADLGLDIHLAKIGSEGERITDAFYVSDARAIAEGRADKKLSSDRIAVVRATLEAELEAWEQA